MASSLLADLRAALTGVANPAKAPAMQAYMKSKLPYLGVQTPLLRRTCKVFLKRRRWTRSEQAQKRTIKKFLLGGT